MNISWHTFKFDWYFPRGFSVLKTDVWIVYIFNHNRYPLRTLDFINHTSSHLRPSSPQPDILNVVKCKMWVV